ncbi:hypothetical protein [Natronococcus wangiae]|uniref:hypothetical protein n=1 Tax=Natronococcus wangiae TaxID=3068275 RepID=UPI00273F304C|nr:hypothetical protein [Natronococcus sp. AD5]
MKRVLTITLTVALFGGLMLMGFAGSAAAQNISVSTGDTGDVDQEAEQEAEINQENNNAQVGIADAEATSGGDQADNLKAYGASSDNGGDGATSTEASVDQEQDVEQSNDAEIDQEIEQEGESGDSGINVELGLLADILSA